MGRCCSQAAGEKPGCGGVVMDKKVVGRLRTYSYPRPCNDPGAAVTCRVITNIVEIRAKSYIAHESWSENIQRALQEFGMPKPQWDEFNESKFALFPGGFGER
jgi:hypothetical protein